jgi:transcriptional regulatory protein RtcR
VSGAGDVQSKRAASRQKRKSVNDADRVRKYLARFGIEWTALRD